MADVTQQITDRVLERLQNGNYLWIIGAVQAVNVKNWGDLPEGTVYGGVGVAVSDTDGTAKRVTAEAIAGYVQNSVDAHMPYVDSNTKTLWTWDAEAKAYQDSGVSLVGPAGPVGPQGPQGISGVAVTAAGQYALNVDERGHLMLAYAGDTAPALSINENGHLIQEVV